MVVRYKYATIVIDPVSIQILKLRIPIQLNGNCLIETEMVRLELI